MIRDVLVQSMAKGLFLPAALFILIFTAILRMPKEDVSTLVFETLDGIRSMYLFGYVMSFVLACGWAFHAKWQRRVLRGEVSRVSDEKTALQNLLTGKDIESSED